MSAAAVSFPAPAKLNLMLRVIGRRTDGYHLLQTIFRFIDYGDEVRLTVRPDGRIHRTHDLPGVAEAEDLTLRAAHLLQTATATPLGAEIDLVKRLPIGGGLGGGSSDAATVLLALNHLWATGLHRSDLQALALRLGADVPVFVFGESAFAEGIGEILAPIALPTAWYAVLTPAVTVVTSRIFSDPELKRDSKPIKMPGFSVTPSADDGSTVNGSPMRNDLELLVCSRHPEVARHLEWLRQYGSARMTGSGACVYAAFDSEAAARKVMSQLPAGMRGFVARGLDRHPLRELAG